jgi:hypothetical protein
MKVEQDRTKPTTQGRRCTIRLTEQSKTKAPRTKDTRALRDLSAVLQVTRAVPELWRSSTSWAAPLIRRASFRRARSRSLQNQVVPDCRASRNTQATKCTMKRISVGLVSRMSQAPMMKSSRSCATFTRGCTRVVSKNNGWSGKAKSCKKEPGRGFGHWVSMRRRTTTRT